jgi:hypothetical protein
LVSIKSINAGQDVIMKLEWNGEFFESKSKRTHPSSTRIIGNKRKEFGVELMAKGVSNFRNELILEQNSGFIFKLINNRLTIFILLLLKNIKMFRKMLLE